MTMLLRKVGVVS